MMQSSQGSRQVKHTSENGFSLLEVIIVVAIIMVLVALTLITMTSSVRNYRLGSSARELASSVQLVKIKATTRDAQYCVVADTSTTPHSYRVEFLPRPGPPSSPPGAPPWLPDPAAGSIRFPAGVSFDNSGISSAPPGQTTAQASGMRFNTRGLLIDFTTGAPLNGSCFYLQGNTGRPLAVCSSLAGKTTVYRLNSGTWEVQ